MVQFTNSPEQSLFQATLRSPINASQTTGIVLSRQIESFTGTIRITILDPAAGAEVISATGQTVGGELTGVVRGLPLYDGGPSTANPHPSGTRVVLSNPFQLYKDIETAVNSKADRDEDTVNKLTVEDWLELQSYPDAAARDVAIAVPVKDMIVILDDDGDGKVCFSVYDGANWKNIALPGRDVVIEGFLRVESGYVKLPVYTDATARDAAITSPEQSMIIYNVNAVTFQFYDGSNWNDLDVGTPVPLATTSTPGRVRLATDQQVVDRVDDVGGEPLVMQPTQIDLKEVIDVTLQRRVEAGEQCGPVAFVGGEYIFGPYKNNFINIDSTLNVSSFSKALAITSEKVLIAFIDSGDLKVVVAIFDLNTMAISFGTPVTIASGTAAVDMVHSSGDKYVISYRYTASNTIVRCKILDVDTGTNVITDGPERDIMTLSSAVNNVGLANIGSDKVAIYGYANTPTDTRVAVFTVVGDSITVGSLETPNTNVQFAPTRIMRLSDDKFVLIYYTTGGSDNLRLQVGEISGTTVTLDSVQNFLISGNNSNLWVDSIADNDLWIRNSTGNVSNVTLIKALFSGTTATIYTAVRPATATPAITTRNTVINPLIYSSGARDGYEYEFDSGINAVQVISQMPNLDSSTFVNGEAVRLGDDVIAINRTSSSELGYSSFQEARVPCAVALEAGDKGDTIKVRLKKPLVIKASGFKQGTLVNEFPGVGNFDLSRDFNASQITQFLQIADNEGVYLY